MWCRQASNEKNRTFPPADEKVTTMDMVKIERCRVTECCYNTDEMCHAMAITFGDAGDHPKCDTYCDLMTKGGDLSAIGAVGACQVSECRYNQSLA
jgi:hypothetical protein